jgi:RND superfamily putative drug exporter
MSRALYRLAGMSYRHRRLVLLAWLLITMGIASLGVLSGGTTVDNFSVPGTQSQQALDQLQQAMPAARRTLDTGGLRQHRHGQGHRHG